MRRGVRRKLGRSGITAALLGVVALAAALYLEGSAGGAGSDALATYAREHRANAAELITRAAGNRRVVIIGDVPGSPEPKRVAGAVLRELARQRGVDALVVGVDSSYQDAFDRYITANPEDASLLLQAPGLINGDADGRELLQLFRDVYKLNVELGADRRIRIIAGATRPWPPDQSEAPKEAAAAFADYGAEMAERIEDEILGRTSGTRIVVLVDAFQALKSGSGEVAAGGGSARGVAWAAAELRAHHPVDVYTALPDAALESRGYPVVARYAGTTLHDQLRRLGFSGIALPVAGPIRALRQPIQVRTGPSVSLHILPDGYTLGDVADAYFMVGAGD